MITEWIVQLATGFAAWLVGLMPDWEAPAELSDADGMLSSILELGAGLGPWVDWAFVGVVALIPLALWAGGLIWKLIRTVASHIPGFGGSG